MQSYVYQQAYFFSLQNRRSPTHNLTPQYDGLCFPKILAPRMTDLGERSELVSSFTLPLLYP